MKLLITKKQKQEIKQGVNKITLNDGNEYFIYDNGTYYLVVNKNKRIVILKDLSNFKENAKIRMTEKITAEFFEQAFAVWSI